MEYRQLPRGTERERFSVLGLGMGGIQNTPPEEIEQIIGRAVDAGINFFDLCAGGAVYAPFGRAIRSRRESVFLQMHFGAVYDEHGEYGWSRDIDVIKRTFEWELETLGTDYADFGFIHCVDDEEDLRAVHRIGLVDHLLSLKAEGVIRHIGFSSHTPAIANKLLDEGIADMMMFSLNPAYDLECGDEYGVGGFGERLELLRRCEREGVGISVMKPFFAGQLLSREHSPFGVALSHSQCLQYALDRPGVLTAVPGVLTLEHLDELLHFLSATEQERDYSVISSFTPPAARGSCVYCNHCRPCPAGIDIGLVNKYYDLALAGDEIAANHYTKLAVSAGACIGCGHCDRRCPFSVKQQERMKIIAKFFEEKFEK